MQHRWAVCNFNSYLYWHKLESNSDSLLGIRLLLKKIVHVPILYILSFKVSGQLTFSNHPLPGKVLRKPQIFQSTPPP